MIISVNWLKDYIDLTMPMNELATLIGARLVEIEEVIKPGDKYKDVVIARVVECEALENSDHLNVVKLDDGGVVANVERDERGLVQVVCGALNVREGIEVAWLPPKTTVPETFGTADPFVLEARQLRGVMSNGMIASPRELALFDDHEGILEVGMDVQPGASFAELFQLNDTLLDIENKSLTHRPDTFGVIGFAREVAGIQGRQFTTPEWLKNSTPEFGEVKAGNLQAPKVTIDNPELSDRYQGVIITNVDGSVKTPLPLQTFLARVGMRPISAIVDTTNYLMLETGQPLHAFDYDKLAAINAGVVDIHVRAGRPGETLELLDGRTIELSTDDIVIANGEIAVALAGAMGGAATEVSEATKTIFLESATFNFYNLRATQMRHGIFSEAITRFTKGQPSELTAPVLAKALQLLGDFMGARQASEVAEDYPGKRPKVAVEVEAKKVNQILGSNLTIEDMLATLRKVEFDVTMTDSPDDSGLLSDGVLYVTPPFWRQDIHIMEDVVEEIGRLNGFDSIEAVLPGRDFTAVRPSGFDTLRAKVRQSLVKAGANEVLTYSFIHGDILKKAGQRSDNSYRIVNSMSPDLHYYRQTLTPSLLNLIHSNSKQGYDNFALFELNKVHPKHAGLTSENVPIEEDALGLVVTNKKSQTGAAYYQAKRLLEYLGESLGIEFAFRSLENSDNPKAVPFEYRRAAVVTEKDTELELGIVGEFKRSVAHNFKLPEWSAGFEVNTHALFRVVQKQSSTYSPISRYPSTERDICFQVDHGVTYDQVVGPAFEQLAKESLETSLTPVDIYQGSDATKKNITVRIHLTSHDKTLTSDEANSVMERVAARVVAASSAVIV